MRVDGCVRTIGEMEMKNASETVRSLNCTACNLSLFVTVR